LRHHVQQMFAALGLDAAALPEVARCLSNLKDTVGADLPVWKRAQRGRPRHLPLDKPKVLKRRAIGRVRDALSEVVKELYLEQVERAARRSRAAEALETARALGAGSRLADFVVLLHLHDEASLRLRSSSDVGAAPSRGRSSSDVGAAPSRGRSSKVMQHSVWIQVGGQGPRRFVPTELCALANKRPTSSPARCTRS
jgi:hypothetical protein